MRISLFFKLTACYIFILVTPYVLLWTLGSHTLRTELLEERKSSLFGMAKYISKEILSSEYDNQTSLDDLAPQLDSIHVSLGASVIILNRDGNVLLNTQSGTPSDKAINVKDLAKDLFIKTYSNNLTIPGVVVESSLCVLMPISGDMQIQGYVLLASPDSYVENQYSGYITILQYFFLLYALASFLVFILIYLFVVYPLNKIIRAAKNYTLGNYDYELNIHTNDEFLVLAKTLTYMAGELNSLDDYRKHFIANISHDFRSPLTSIKGYIEAMQDGTIPVDNQEKYFNIILFETERLTKLTKDLLELNGFENKKTGFTKNAFDINMTIKKTAESFEGVCMNKRIRLQLDFSQKETIVNADIGKIQQVLHNLLDNAIKFSHNDSKIKISTIIKGDKALISIKDYGIGIPKDSLNHIWDRFYKIDTSRGKDKKGTGLGLSIVKEIINAHGEHINVISTEGVGSEFIFSLPLH